MNNFALYQNVILRLESNGYKVENKIDGKVFANYTKNDANGYILIEASKADDNVAVAAGDCVCDIFIHDSMTKSADFDKMLNKIPKKYKCIEIISREYIKKNIQTLLLKYKDVDIRNYTYNTFRFDIRNNVMVPTHILISDKKEIKTILDDIGIGSTLEMPEIFLYDPQVIWLMGKVGQIVKILRNTSNGTVVVYRLIV